MKKTLILGVICLFAAAGLAFSGGKSEGQGAALEGTDKPLEFYGWDFQPDQIRRYCNEFEQANNEKINVNIIPNIGYVPTLQTRIMGGARVDVFYNFRWNQLRYYNVGWAHGLSDFPGAADVVADIIDSAKPAYHTKDGELISLPYFAAPFVLMYNPSMLSKAGFDNFPSTKEDMYQMCVALKGRGIKSPYVAYWNKDFIDRYFFIYLISEGIEVFDKDFNPVFQNNVETKKVMQWWVKMYQDGLTSSTILTDGPSEGAISIQEGNSAFFNLHHYFLKGIRESGAAEGKNVVLGPQIPGAAGTTLQIGEIIQMGGNTPDPQRAWKLLKYYSWKDDNGNYKVPKTWAFAAGLLVPYKGFFQDQEIIESFKTWIDWDRLNDIFQNKSKIETVRKQVWYPDWRTESADVLHQMLLNDISVDKAIQEAAAIAVRLKKEVQ